MKSMYNILIVDDISDNIKVAMNILKNDNYDFSFALDGKQALEIVKSKDFDLILLDIMMPGIDGFEVCKILKANDLTKEIPVIFLTANNNTESIAEAFYIGAVDYLTKPFNSSELIARVTTHLELYRAKQILKQNNLDLSKEIQIQKVNFINELKSSQEEIIYILTELMESSSSETGKHIKRVALISKLLANLHPFINEEEEELIYFAAPMHDIGKITISEHIIGSPNKLTTQEFIQMKEHTTNAYNILNKSSKELLKVSAIIAHQHHEKYDGSGYPNGLKGVNIHLYARIVSLADVLDALTHERIYKEPWGFDKAANYIIGRKMAHFDPVIVDIFENNLDKFKLIIES